jgi:hypothetical protein
MVGPEVPSSRVEKKISRYELALVRGTSRTLRQVLAVGDSVRHLVIGSSSRCDWRIAARGVRSRHFRLTCAGGRLRIEDIWEPQSVSVDGLQVGARLELPCAAQIEFGEAVLRVFVVGTESGAQPHIADAHRR